MELTFLGAAREVTGSCTLLSACGRNIVIDCGMEQGLDIYENTPLPISPTNVDCVLLTHAHIDHSGKIPKLVAGGYRNKIYATGATKKLCNIMLRDSAHIQETEAEWKSRKAKRAGDQAYQPMYTMKDVERTMPLFVACDYDSEYDIFDGIRIKFFDAGHLLGSASIEVTVTENGVTKKIVFSGDVGNVSRPLIRDPKRPTEGDIFVLESTYGDRIHGERKDYVAQLKKIIQETLDRGGNLIIPSFAIGRTQEMLYLIHKIKDEGLIKGHGDFPVWVDSPLAVEATRIYAGDMKEYYDAETLQYLDEGINVLNFPGLNMSVTSDESKSLNNDMNPKVIISASGMCEAGRIKHHLKHNLWREDSTILFVGYQSVGTIGRAIIDGAETVKLFGEDIMINAHIEQMEGISGHADKPLLLKWLENVKPERVFVNHGNDEVCEDFAATIKNELNFYTTAPHNGAKYDLVSGECLNPGTAEKIVRGEGSKGFSAAFLRLKRAGDALMALINTCRGLNNRDTDKFAKQITDLAHRWSK